jgi:hypothetical protein
MNKYKQLSVLLTSLLLTILLATCQSIEPTKEVSRFPEPMNMGEITEGNVFAFALLFEGPGTELEHKIFWNINGLDKYPLWINGTELHLQGESVRLENGWIVIAIKNLPIGRQVLQLELVSSNGKHVRNAFSVHVKPNDDNTVVHAPVIGVRTTFYPPGTFSW